MKGIAVKTLFLVVVIGMIIFFSLVIFWHLLDLQRIEANKAACLIKQRNYCERCVKNNKCPGDWNQIKPEGCGDFGIYEPSLEECKKMMGLE
ncbi:MAG: hypothetical protein QMD12_02715 [Candidatus Aenigmarchaeota archaeon]|nr:hypothetical protein [Candidatus Aenigmarchaeota archaeon]